MTPHLVPQSPSNLKEAIDWILRVTGKDGGGGGGTSQLANAVSTLLKDVKSSSPELEEKFDEIKKALYSGPNNGIIGGLGTGLEKFKEGIKSQGYNVNVYQTLTGNNLNDVPNAAKIFLGCVPLCFYSLSYLYWRCSDGDVKNGGWKTQTLTTEYLGYFMNAHGFNSKQLSDKQGTRVVSEAMKDKFEDFKEGISTAKGMAEQRANKEDEARTKLGIGDAYVPDFRTGTPSTKVAANKNPTYPEYLHALCGKWCNGPSAFTPSDDKPLSSIYYICRLYFQGKQKLQSDLPNLKPRPPTTIREMLYFLAALPFSPSYDAFDKYLTRHFTSLSGNSDATYDAELMIPVADSASVNTNNTLSAADLKDYLTNTCHYSTTILSVIQGNSGSENPGEPWLHELYSNGLRFTYPPDSGLFSTLSNYTYALQFQLYFLFTQCAGTYSEGCGWNQCTYGSEMNKNLNTAVLSHICTGFKCNGASGCRHNGGSTNLNCKHNKLKDAESCGQSNGSLSPLQAFLTDKLKGFSLYDKPDTNSPSHLSDHPPGFMCHVKMGFTPQSLRSNARKGNYIYRVLEPFCGNSHSPLRQLSEKLGCLTKRTPRTLGDLFGFTWHLNGQLFKYRPKLKTLIGKFLNDFGIQNLIPSTTSNPYLSITELWKKILERNSTSQSPQNHTSSVISRSIASMAPAIPFLYQLFMTEDPNTLPGAIFDLTQHCHGYEASDGGTIKIVHKSPGFPAIDGHTCSEPSDLWSLYYPISQASAVGAKDTHSACRNKNCGGYLEPLTLTYGATFSPSSAAAYLSWIAYLTDDFFVWLCEMLNEFNNISCDHCNPRCPKGKSCHTSSSGCSCYSVITCAGILPLLYRHGFQFHDAYSLKDTSTKRTCQKLSQQLSNVLSSDSPLAKLLESIDSFLYMFRMYFFYNLSSFWLCSLAILLYFIIYGIDVLHLQSHAHLPSSHSVPPIGLLTTGKALPVTKLTYYLP